jgi:hypothetical protein
MYYRSKKKSGYSSYSSGEKACPVGFFPGEGDKVVKFTVNNPGFSKMFIETFIHEKSLKLEYQSFANEGSCSFDDEIGLTALIGLKPKGVVAARKTGEQLIKQTLPRDLQQDSIAETVFGISDEEGKYK